MRQLLTESVLLSVAGGAVGLAAAPLAVALLVKFAERFTTRAAEVKLDAPVLIFTLLISLATGILFGLAPAFSSSRNFGDALKQGITRITATQTRQRFRNSLVIAQVAVSFMLLIGAGLMIRSFIKLQKVNPGFNPDRVLALRVSSSFSKYGPDEQRTLDHNILRRVSEIGGIQFAALAWNFPFNPGGIASGPGVTEFEIEGRRVSKGDLMPQVDTTGISPQYFQTIRQPLVRGREFTPHDDSKAPAVAIINETMARHRWPAEDPIGKRITFDQGRHWTTIVGIAGDVREYGLDRPVGDELYLPIDQAGSGNNLIVRTAVDPLTIAPLIRSALHELDPQLAIDRVNTLKVFEYDSVASPRLTSILLGIFAALAVFISASGIAAVMALAVAQRTHELGIRMALGAKRNSILAMVLRHGIFLAAIGIVIGIAGAILLTRLLSSLLYATSPTDVATFSAVSLLFLAVATLACFIPARQVTSIDPVVALRTE
jgi:predicted permease